MAIMTIQPGLNTFGLGSINSDTFNQINGHGGLTYPKPLRDVIYTALKLNNGIFNGLGYFGSPKIRYWSGVGRSVIGGTITLVTLAIGTPKTDQRGPIIGRFYHEALYTGLAQMARGVATAADLPYMRLVMGIIDCVATFFNVIITAAGQNGSMVCQVCQNGGDLDSRPSPDHIRAHEPPNNIVYNLLFWV